MIQNENVANFPIIKRCMNVSTMTCFFIFRIFPIKALFSEPILVVKLKQAFKISFSYAPVSQLYCNRTLVAMMLYKC